jgi:hypothetical protein
MDRKWLLLCILILLVYKTGLVKLLLNGFRPGGFTITVNGIVSKEGFLFPWSQIKEVVFFNHCGYRHVGIRLNENVVSADGKSFDEIYGKDSSWSLFKMPILTMTRGLNIYEEKLAKIFENDYKIPVRYGKKDIEAGNEWEL